jgi:hypothetical protein
LRVERQALFIRALPFYRFYIVFWTAALDIFVIHDIKKLKLHNPYRETGKDRGAESISTPGKLQDSVDPAGKGVPPKRSGGCALLALGDRRISCQLSWPLGRGALFKSFLSVKSGRRRLKRLRRYYYAEINKKTEGTS